MRTFLAWRSLVPHADAPPAAIGSVRCSISWQGPGQWCFDYVVEEPAEALRLPDPVPPARTNGLWRRTCFELFLRQPGSEEYFEFNFSPSGEWAAYRFEGRRSGMTDLQIARPRITSSNPQQFALAAEQNLIDTGVDPASAASLAAASLVEAEKGAASAPASTYILTACLDDRSFGEPVPWLGGISAIIEEADGTTSYWALAHPQGEPDFHHPACFVLELPPPAAA